MLLFAGSSVRADVFSYTGLVVDYTIPTTGFYSITAAGAQGGSDDDAVGGLGALAAGEVFLTQGVELLAPTAPSTAPSFRKA
jgi:hypothetical protein